MTSRSVAASAGVSRSAAQPQWTATSSPGGSSTLVTSWSTGWSASIAASNVASVSPDRENSDRTRARSPPRVRDHDASARSRQWVSPGQIGPFGLSNRGRSTLAAALPAAQAQGMTTQVSRPTRPPRPAPEARLVPRQQAPVVRIRPIRPADGDALERFYENLSPESRWARFFGGTAGLSHEQASSFCTPDHHHREGFVAEIPAVGRGLPQVVGHLCLEPDGAGAAEVAVAVADAHQGRGIGRRLMNAGLTWAGHEGISTLTATMLEGNVGIRRLVAGLGLRLSFRPIGSNVLAVTIDLRPRSAAA